MRPPPRASAERAVATTGCFSEALITSVEFLDLDAPGGASASPAANPAAATRDAPFVNSLGMKFVPVPITGGPTDGKRVLFSIWETRRRDYEVFVQRRPSGVVAGTDFPQAPEHPW